MRKISLLSVGLALFLFWHGAAAAEDFIILSSTAPAFQVGDVVTSGTKIVLPEKKRLVLINGAGRTLKLVGPYSGSPGDSAEEGSSQVMTVLASLVRTTRDDARSVGAVRAAGIKTERQAMMVNVSETGDYCGYQGAPRELTRYGFEKGATVTITAVENSQAQTIEWNQGTPYIPWPSSLPVKDGATYLVEQAGKDTRVMIIMHQIEGKYDNPVTRILQMGEMRCLEQVKMLLALLRNSAT